MSTGTPRLDLLLAEGNAVAAAVAWAPLEAAHVVVTGASGLIGSTLLASLAAVRERGISFDLTLLVRSRLDSEIAQLVRRCGAQVILGDLAGAPVELDRRADVVIHAAGASAPGQFMKRPLETLAIGACATLQLLRTLAPGGRFLFLSSTEIYSGFKGQLASEDDIGTTTPLHPRAGYIEAKRAGETACMGARAEGTNAVAVRVGMTYGPGTRPGDTRVINRLIEQALRTGRVELLDGGEALRSLCYVTDTVELLWNAVLRGREAIYNVAGRDEMTVRELGRRICGATGSELIVPKAPRSVPGAPGTVRVDVSRATAEFGKRDWVSLDDGLSRTLAWQRLLYLSGAGQ